MVNLSEGIEGKVEGHYIIYPARAANGKEEQQQRYAQLLSRVEELQAQYAGKFNCYRKFQFTHAVAAVITENEIIKLLMGEGYAVEKQAEMKGLKPNTKNP